MVRKQLLKQAKQFRQTLKQQPNQPAALHHEYGLVLYDLGRLDEAIAQFSLACKLEPNHCLTCYHWGMALLLQGKLAEATHQFNTALEAEASQGAETSGEAARHLPKLGKTAATLFSGDRDGAIAQLEAILDEHPNLLTTHLNLLLSFYGEAKREQLAQATEATISAEPSIENFYQLALVRHVQKEHGEAIQIANQGLEQHPEAVLLLLARSYGESGNQQVEAAIATINQALEHSPNHVALLHQAARLQFQANPRISHSQIRQLCGRVLEQDPNFAPAVNNLGLTQSRWQQKAACPHYYQAIRLDPLLAVSYQNLGNRLGWSREERKTVVQMAQYNLCFVEATASPQAIQTAQSLLKWAQVRPSVYRWTTAGLLVLVSAMGITQLHELDRQKRQDNEFITLSSQTTANRNASQWLALAQERMNHKAYVEATEAYQQAINLDPDNAEYWAGQAKSLAYTEQVDAAEKSIQKAIALAPDEANFYNRYGWLLYTEGRYDEAITQLQKAVELDPADPDPYFFWGKSLHKQRRYDEAIAVFQTGIDNAEPSSRLHEALADSLICQEDNETRQEDALAQYEKAIELDPENVSARVGMARLARAMTPGWSGERAVPILEEAIAIDPNNGEAYEALGNAHWISDSEAAAAAYQKAVELNPKNKAAYRGLMNTWSGEAYENPAFFEKMLSLHQQTVEQVPDRAWPHILYSNALNNHEDRLDEALEQAQLAIQKQPNDDDAHMALGDVYREQEQIDEAIAAYEKVLELCPSNCSAHYYLGDLYDQKNQGEKAFYHYKKAFDSGIHVPDRLAEIYEEKGNWAEAAVVYQGKTEIQSSRPFPETLEKLGNAFVQSEQIDEAAQAYEQAGDEYFKTWEEDGFANDYYQHREYRDGALASYQQASQLYETSGQPDAASAVKQKMDRVPPLPPES